MPLSIQVELFKRVVSFERGLPSRGLCELVPAVADLHGEADCDFLALPLRRELVERAAQAIAGDERALGHLDDVTRDGFRHGCANRHIASRIRMLTVNAEGGSHCNLG